MFNYTEIAKWAKNAVNNSRYCVRLPGGDKLTLVKSASYFSLYVDNECLDQFDTFDELISYLRYKEMYFENYV